MLVCPSEHPCKRCHSVAKNLLRSVSIDRANVMASPPTCVECIGVSIRPIDLDCENHYICRECIKKRRGDLSCKLCGQQDQEEEMVFVYMDNSNTWIEAKKLLGSKGQEDHRVRIDVGELLKVVAKGRHVAEANLYGSEPPPLDTVWEKMREKGWVVIPHKRNQITDKEKQVDTQLVTDATRMACKTKPGNNTIIFISGDADMKPAIEAIMEEGWKVEVFMWNHALSKELKKLDHKDLCTVCPLDSYKDKITYNSMRFPIANNNDLHIVREKGIVCKMKANCFKSHVPTDHWCKTVTEALGLDFRYFWMEELNEKTKKCVNNSLVLVFAKVTASSFHIAKILEIHRTCPIKYVLEIKTYLQYEQEQSDNTSNFFYQMENHPLSLLSEESDSIFGFVDEDENLSEAEYFSVLSESEKRDLDLDSCLSDHDTDVDNDSQPGEWRYAESKHKKKTKQLYSQQCQDGIRCRKGSSCSYKHTEDERRFFKTNNGRGRPKNWKTELCRYHPKCKNSSNQCDFAHGEADAFCKTCRKGGHLTTNCTNK